MGFFDQFAHEGKKVDGSEENTTVHTSSTLPGGTRAVSVIEEMKWDEYEGVRKIKVRWKLADTDLKGRTTFQNLELYARDRKTGEPDKKKAFRAANVLRRLFMLTGVPVPDAEPTDADFAQMVGKMAGIAIELWENDGKSGNWVSEIQPAKGFESCVGTEMPSGDTGSVGGKTESKQPELSPDEDW